MVTSFVEDSPREVIEAEAELPVHLAIGDAGFLGERARVSPPTRQVKAAGPSEAGVRVPPAQPGVQLADLFQDQTRRMLRDLEVAPDSPSLLNAVGLSYLNQGLVDQARQHFEKAVSRDPKNVQGRFNLVRCELAGGRVARALELCAALAEEQPLNESIHITLADIYGRLGKREEAVSRLTAVLSTKPESAAALYNRGVQQLLLQRFDKAIADFRSAIRSDVRFAAAHNSLGVCYLVNGAPRRAVRHLKVAARLDKTPEVKKNLVMALLEVGSHDEALELLQEHMARFPRDWEATELLARAYREKHQFAASLRTLLQVLKAYGDNDADRNSIARVHNNLGVAYSELGEYDKAAEHYEASLALSEGVPIPFHNLARQYLSLGRIQKARRLFEEHGHRFPDDALTLAVGGRLATLFGDLTKAEALFRQAIQVDPKSLHGYTALATLLGDHQGDYEEAKETTLEGLERIPSHPMLLNNLAYYLLMLGRVGEAKQVLDRIRGHQDNVYVTATRGLLLIREGMFKEGARLYDRAARLANGDVRTLVVQKKQVEMARSYCERGRFEEAHALLRSALSVASKLGSKDLGYTRQAAALLETIRGSEREKRR